MSRYLIAAALLLASTSAQATVDYAIDLTAPEHHTGKVTVVFPQTAGPYLDVKMPAWRTGRYTIMNLANGVREFSATDGQGQPLRWEKVDKSTWRIHLDHPSAIRLNYELYADELSLRSRHIDDSHAYLDASAVFMYADPYRKDDVTVSLAVPPAWKSVSGMDSPSANRFVAGNWDILVDSPIETGIHKQFSFDEGGRDYEVVIWGEGNYDTDAIVTGLKKMVGEADTIWSGYPFHRYVFMIHATDGPGGGATEHRNSTVIQLPRYYFGGHHLGFLSTASHEFIHTWNVKSYRGAGLVPYHYQSENYSDLLWVAEGSTSYFEDHLLLRAGLMKPEQYFATLANAIDHNRHTPGTSVQSVADASFNEWISVSGDRARNASTDIYSEGSLVSWMLDIALLEQTGGKVSYRDVHDALYKRFKSEDGRGFTAVDMRAILAELTGKSWDDWWARNVDSPVGKVDFGRLLDPVGLRLVEDNGPPAPYAGWSGNESDGGMRLTTVERGSPAWNAGFTPDDIIVALDGKRVSDSRFDEAIGEYQPGATVTVSYFRRDQLAQKQLTLGAAPKNDPKVVTVDRPTRAQKALFERWLLIPYPEG
ncbi:MAG TPA: PDZ domain-containing protein [Sphingomicrobium sp.]|nr:PDZ domain-containing protein [Sphingomicrobium sp.]